MLQPLPGLCFRSGPSNQLPLRRSLQTRYRGQVQRGETGTRILYWHFEDRRAARDSNGRPVRDEKGATVYETWALQSPRVYTYNVFNAEQCDSLPAQAEGRRP